MHGTKQEKGKRQNKNGEVEKMARKDDILSIYTKEVEGIKEAGLFKGEAPVSYTHLTLPTIA